MGLFSRKSTGSSYSADRLQSNSIRTANLDEVRTLINSKITRLESDSFPASGLTTSDGGRSINCTREEVQQLQEMNQRAIEAKRAGNLRKANSIYIDMLRSSTTENDEALWSWCKIMILAKNWKDLVLLLKYKQAIYARSTIIRKRNDPNYSVFPPFEWISTFDYYPPLALRQMTDSRLANKAEVIARMPSFGGNDAIWGSWSLTDDEYREFLRYFFFPDVTEDGARYGYR